MILKSVQLLCVLALGGAVGYLVATKTGLDQSRAQAQTPGASKSAPVEGGSSVLPRPDPPFKGHIGRTAKDSTKDFPQEVQAPKGAPNILVILTDDVGFGASSTFGGPIPTPTFDRLAKNGLRY